MEAPFPRGHASLYLGFSKMSKIVETIINNFGGGVSNDPRDPRENVCRMVTNFDPVTNPHKMTPIRATESGNDGSVAINIQNFAIARTTGTTYHLYALGRGPSSNITQIGRKALTTGAATDLDDSAWADVSAGSAIPTFDTFVAYRAVDRIYGLHGSAIFEFDPTASTINNSVFAITYTNSAQGLVHSKDDILYIPIDNKIYRKNNTGAFELALTLPTHFYITSICEYGNQIAIAMAPLSGVLGQSRVFIWDRDISLTTLSETIPWEDGSLRVLDVVDGYLVGITLSGNATLRFNQKIIFRYLAGSQVEGYRAEKFFEIQSIGTSVTAQLPIAKQMQDGRLFFMMVASIGGSTREGLWSIGRVGDQFSLVHENTPSNAIATSTATMRGFFLAGDFRFIAYDEAGTYTLRKTDDANTFTTSIWEKRFNTQSSSIVKKLKGVSVSIEPLDSVVDDAYFNLLCRIDDESSYKRIFRAIGDGNKLVSHEAVNIEPREQTFTVTIASPGVFTLSAHALVVNQRVTFTTTGTLPTGLTAGTEYFVISAGLTADAFRVSTSRGGSAVNTSGSQSGTHTLSRLDNLPEYKEIEFRIEAIHGTTAVEITELRFKEEILDQGPF